MRSDDWRIEHFDVIESTNTYVGNCARNGSAEGLVAVADFQLAGKGRLDRTWTAPPGSSLLCSVLLRPPVSHQDMQLVVAAAALAVRGALANVTGCTVALKWPNDLLHNEKKLAGLLSEYIATPAGPALVLGIGLNCTSHDPSLPQATNVLAATGFTVEPRALLDVVLTHLAFRRHQLDTPHGVAALRADYVAALSTIGSAVRIETGTGTVHGTALAVDETGALIVDVNGTPTTFRVGDIVHIRPEDRP